MRLFSFFLLLALCPFDLKAEPDFNGTNVTAGNNMEADYTVSSLGRQEACCDEDRHRIGGGAHEMSKEESQRIVSRWLTSPSSPASSSGPPPSGQR